nr:MAG TPA: GLI-Kruppel family member HKR3-C2H2 domain, GLI-Kruppel family member [Caudoviricetes sp.]
MANAKKCDRCGKLFEPYWKLDGHKNPQEFVKLLVMHTDLDNKNYPSENVYVDLCNECHESFSRWLAKQRIIKHECSYFGNLDKQNYKCKSCPRYQECKKETKEKKQKICDKFGTFDESVDCLLCPQCDACRDATNAIKEANSNGK